MARPKSEDKRNAIMAAATRVIDAKGLGAPTAAIAQEAGLPNGSLFTYFETKADLYNQLYLDLKAGLAAAAMKGLPAEAGLREQALLMWENWMKWAIASPEKRRALEQLSVCDEITPESRTAGHRSMAGIAELLERSRAQGPMRDAPMGFVLGLMSSLAEATMNYMLHDPKHAKKHCGDGFDALWRVIA